MAITVTLKLFGDLRKYRTPGTADPQMVAMHDGSTIRDLCATIGIDARDDVIAGVNGEQADAQTALNDGDQVMLVSPMEGG
jgi:sulfur carrier protein ThiS